MTWRAEWHLDNRHLGKRVLIYERLESTNSTAAVLARDEANHGLVVLAEEQTAGRGQHGRSWQCPAGMGVLLSIVMFPSPSLRRPALLTAWAAVAVRETIRNVIGLPATIKWPNDMLVRGRKVCGILIEQGHGAVAGIGLNVNQPAPSFAELPNAASLAMFTNQALNREEVARLLIEQLDHEYDRLVQGEVRDLETRWRKGIGLLGHRVTVDCHLGSVHGLLRRLDLDGLELMLAEGEALHLKPEMVQHLDAQGVLPCRPFTWPSSPAT